MREALAAANQDFIAKEGRGAQTRRRDKPAKAKPLPLWRRMFGGKRSTGAMLFLGFAAIAAIGVPVNALFLQDGRHPAPIFQKAASILALPTAPQQAHGPAQQGEPAKPLHAAPAVKSETAAATETTRVEAAKPAEKSRDLIGRLLEGGAPRNASADDKNKTVLAAQRALAKLGFALHQDGVFGGTTRQAIEKFERANGMPVTGELSPKIRRLLSARTGIAVK
ncbi:peptidoglycan-binding domain-containing protein [Methylocystis heyeri]|uniref:Peptidoglycan-binding protein n=1 Tax=Methylocystis heyeri TaxID=391905 RepID=A0A6B8K974_9HYPH|nr:peptidoglycan-binding domain-containing protein [Methylocystis heyeri]QGM44636.1 peptidoglycan-binding protein [Methylocystis heyeri]